MSTVYSVGYTKYVASRKTDPGEWGGRMRLCYDEYEAVALAAASTIYMFLPYAKERYAGFGQLAWDDLGTGNTLAVGIVGTTEKFLAATDAATAADMTPLDAGATAIDALGYEFDGDTPVIITGAGGAHTGTIKLAMMMFGI